MNETAVNATMDGGAAGLVGGRVAHIENLTYAVALRTRGGRQDRSLPPCPYPGLAYFGPHDAARFFGRETGDPGSRSGRRQTQLHCARRGIGQRQIVCRSGRSRAEARRPRRLAFDLFPDRDRARQEPVRRTGRCVRTADGIANSRQAGGGAELAGNLASGASSLTNVVAHAEVEPRQAHPPDC